VGWQANWQEKRKFDGVNASKFTYRTEQVHSTRIPQVVCTVLVLGSQMKNVTIPIYIVIRHFDDNLPKTSDKTLRDVNPRKLLRYLSTRDVSIHLGTCG